MRFLLDFLSEYANNSGHEVKIAHLGLLLLRQTLLKSIPVNCLLSSFIFFIYEVDLCYFLTLTLCYSHIDFPLTA